MTEGVPQNEGMPAEEEVVDALRSKDPMAVDDLRRLFEQWESDTGGTLRVRIDLIKRQAGVYERSGLTGEAIEALSDAEEMAFQERDDAIQEELRQEIERLSKLQDD